MVSAFAESSERREKRTKWQVLKENIMVWKTCLREIGIEIDIMSREEPIGGKKNSGGPIDLAPSHFDRGRCWTKNPKGPTDPMSDVPRGVSKFFEASKQHIILLE
jgi:hypothetical protein